MIVDFKPGYYEWNVIVDGNVIYTFGDFLEDLPYPLSKEKLIVFCENLISVMEIDLENQEIEYDPFILILLVEAMKRELWNRYGEIT